MTQLDLPFMNSDAQETSPNEEEDGRYYIIRLDSYYGEHSSLSCEADDVDYMFSVLVVHKNSANLIDYGYSSIEQLLEAWNNVDFLNLNNVIEEHERYKQNEDVIKRFRRKLW